MATVSCMPGLHGPRLDPSDCLCGRRLALCGNSALDGLTMPRGRLSRRLLAVQSVLSPFGADRATGRTRTSSRGRRATTTVRTPHVRKNRPQNAAAAPARRRLRQAPTTASEEQDARSQHGDPPAESAAPGLYQDCCGRVYARSVYRIEVLDELMLDGLRLAELRGSATFATVTSAVSTSAVTIADVVAAAGASANAADLLDRACEGTSGVEQACPLRCTP